MVAFSSYNSSSPEIFRRTGIFRSYVAYWFVGKADLTFSHRSLIPKCVCTEHTSSCFILRLRLVDAHAQKVLCSSRSTHLTRGVCGKVLRIPYTRQVSNQEVRQITASDSLSAFGVSRVLWKHCQNFAALRSSITRPALAAMHNPPIYWKHGRFYNCYYRRSRCCGWAATTWLRTAEAEVNPLITLRYEQHGVRRWTGKNGVSTVTFVGVCQ